MENMESEGFHSCKGMTVLSNPPPYFYVHDDALDTATGEHFRAVMLAIAGQFSYVACQVDFCPWCGDQLAAYTLARSVGIVADKEGYTLYRKRHVRSEQHDVPVGKDKWITLVDEYEQTRLLVPHAKPEHAETLMRRLATLKARLALDTVVTEGEEHASMDGDGQP